MTYDNFEQIAKRIRLEIAVNDDLSVSELASEIGVSQGRVSQLLSSNRPKDVASLEQQLAMAKYVGLSPVKAGIKVDGFASPQEYTGLYVIECRLNDVVFTKVGIAKELDARVLQSLEDFAPYQPEVKLTVEMRVGGFVYALERMISEKFKQERFKQLRRGRESYVVSALTITDFVLAALEPFHDFCEVVVFDESLVDDPDELL